MLAHYLPAIIVAGGSSVVLLGVLFALVRRRQIKVREAHFAVGSDKVVAVPMPTLTLPPRAQRVAKGSVPPPIAEAGEQPMVSPRRRTLRPTHARR